MRRIHFCLAAVLVALSACEKNDVPFTDPQPEPVQQEDPWLFRDLSGQLALGPEGFRGLDADFGGTRSQLEMNGAGTYAKVVWSAGDSFRMYAKNNSSGSFNYAAFTTQDGGDPARFTTGNYMPDEAPAPYHAVYPSVSKLGTSGDLYLLGVTIPSAQTAIPGNIADGLSISYACAQTLTEDLHFQSMVSLVRFRLSGGIVSSVKTVTLRGASPMAGDAIIVPDGEGGAEITMNRSFNGDEHVQSVDLTGSFVAGQDYYIVVAPGAQSGFQMIFSDDEGHTTTKTAASFTFPRGRISDFGTIDLGDAFTDDYVDTTPILYKQATAGAPKPVTIAVIPEGFTESELSSYEMLARSGVDALLSTEPFKSYAEYFNVWILKAVSNESGANVTDGSGNITEAHDCYFGSKWGSNSYGDMAANSSTVYEFVQKNCPDIKDGTHTIQEVPVLMIINDTRYGGICHSFSDGRGYCMSPYSYSGGGISWSLPSIVPTTDDPLPTPVTSEMLHDYYRQRTQDDLNEVGGYNTGDWRNTLVHEFGGHCFGRLGDEYWGNTTLNYTESDVAGQNWPVPFSMNLASNPATAPWKADLLDNLEELVSGNPLYGRIGTYQGGDNYLYGRWRSEKISCMIDNRFYFSTWQRILIVKRIMSLSGSTFDMDAFWTKDVATDPVRDEISSSVYGQEPLPLREMPLLPPPVLHEI